MDISTLHVGSKVRTLRREQRLSQQALGALAGVTLFAICRIERGHVLPRTATLIALADALGVTVGELLGERVA